MSHTEYTQEQLEKMNTVQLIGLLNSTRAQISIGSRQFESDCPVYKVINEVAVQPYVKFSEQLKAILSTRENIPNKEQRKLARQKAQKEKQNR